MPVSPSVSVSVSVPPPPRRRAGGPLGLAAVVALSLTGGGCVAVEDPTGAASEAVVVCAHGATVEGIDVSVYQSTVDWPSVRAAGRVFAIARVGDGTGHDPTFARNWSGMRSAGIIRGAYQFFRPGDDPTALADIMVGAVGMLGAGDLPCTLDVEAADGVSAGTIAANIRTWIDRVQAGTGKLPMIYTGYYFWRDSVGSTAFGADPLWIAAYGPACPNVPSPWTDWRFFQYTDAASVSGVSGGVDGDRFNGTLVDLQAFAGMASGPDWAARYVSQSFPLASAGAVTLHAGESAPAYIELRNVGTATWDGSTHLATTEPRDRTSVFAAPDWPGADRPSAVTGTVAPGGTFRFNFTLHAPAAPGDYDEHFGMVQDGVAWFSDPGQGGPADDVIEARITVLPALPPPVDAGPDDVPPPPVDAGTPDAGPPEDTGTPADDVASSDDTPSVDAGTPAGDGGTAVPVDGGSDAALPGPDAGRAVGDGGVAGVGELTGGCGCAVPGPAGAGPLGESLGGALCAALAVLSRRRSGDRRRVIPRGRGARRGRGRGSCPAAPHG